MTASLDGVDPHPTDAVGQLRYRVYAQRELGGLLRDKATLLALLGNKEGAAAAAQQFLNLAIPDGTAEPPKRDTAALERAWDAFTAPGGFQAAIRR